MRQIDAVIAKIDRRIWFIMVGLLAFVSLFVFSGYFQFSILGQTVWHTADDHMITQRVAYNFWNYGVPYFNQNEPVAANTSLFWPIFLSPLYAVFDHDQAVFALVLMSLVATAAALAMTSQLIGSRLFQVLLVVLMAATPPFARYAATGWEHIPQMLLITIGLTMILLGSRRADRLVIPTVSLILISLSFLFRPDSAITIAVVFLAWFLTDRRYQRSVSYLIAIALLLILTAYLGGMLFYYDDLVPNTAYLKIETVSESLKLGLSYITDLKKTWLFPAFVVGLMVIPKQTPGKWLFVSIAVGQMAYTIFVGGDVFSDGRFFLILLPVTVFLLFSLLEDVDLKTVSVSTLVFSVALVFTAASSATHLSKKLASVSQPSISYLNMQGHVRTMALAECALTPDDGSIGLHFLGVGYHAPGFHIVDFLGKAEPTIARTDPKFGRIGHNKWDYPYAFATYDIAVIPIRDTAVERARDPGFVIPRTDTMYLVILARFLDQLGGYTFVPSHELGNAMTGAFIKSTLLTRERFATCIEDLND